MKCWWFREEPTCEEVEEQVRKGVIGDNSQQGFLDNTITTSRYKWHNFVYRNLAEQFRRVANFYFLIIGLLMVLGWYFPQLFQSSINPWGTVGTLIFVLGVTMVKDGYEDKKRHKADKRENSSAVRVLRHGEQLVIEKHQVQVGDYALVQNKETFPADLILVASSNQSGQCFVETSNIDGETNLKIRKVPKQIVDLGLNSVERLAKKGTFQCDIPNKSIHNFNAVLDVNETQVPVGVSNFLLRGSILRNTQWIVGLVVYTGEDTKIMKNRGEAPSKLSQIERTVNKLIIIVFFTQFCMVVLAVILNSIFSAKNDFEYLGGAENFIFPTWLATFCTFYILFSNFLPISLYVTVEMVNIIQAYFIENDIDMYYEPEDVQAVCRNSTLCQEIGQVEYIFSDKTGTLTANIMEFKQASINGKVYDLETAKAAVLQQHDQHVLDFFRLLSMCHTVVPDEEAEGTKYAGLLCPAYEAESPDEAALVEAASHVGIRFFARTADTGTVMEFDSENPQARKYKLLAVNEFNSTRKRMSILVQDPEDNFVLLCKGADNVMFERSIPAEDKNESLNEHLTRFAQDGLRTLVCSKRNLTAKEAEAWLAEYHQAELKVNNRAAALESVAEKIEKNMEIVGASAIEDRLQDDVAETLEDLKAAGIKVWVLTGDKLETAVNIGYSCKVLNPTMRVVTIATDTKEEAEEELLRLENVLTVAEDSELMGKFRTRMKQMKSTMKNVIPKSMMRKKIPKTDTDDRDEAVNLMTTSARNLVQNIVDESKRSRFGSDTSSSLNSRDSIGATRVVRSPSDASDGGGIAMSDLSSLGLTKKQIEADSLQNHNEQPFTTVDLEGGLQLDDDVEKVTCDPDTSFVASAFAQSSRGLNHITASPEDDLAAERLTSLQERQSASLETLADYKASTDHLALVIDGKTLSFIMDDSKLRRSLLHVGQVCKAVIACRVSPAQKAEIVSLVKHGIKSKPVTLAIGDGANDVTMIQRAHLGIGISGREGRQAVNASDFAIAQFRFLRKLLLFHGRSNYRRMSKVILLCFYKNICLVFTLFIFSFFSLMSGTSPYDSWLYSGFNWFTGMMPVLIGAFDSDMSAEFLVSLPVMYLSGRDSLYLNRKSILQWIGRAGVHSIICAAIPILIGLGLGLPDDLTSLYPFGTLMFTGVIFTVILIMGLETTTWNGFHWFFYPGSIALYFFSLIIFSLLPTYYSLVGVAFEFFPQAMVWALAVFLIPLTCYVLEVTWKYLRLQFYPTVMDAGAEVDNHKSSLTLEQFKHRLGMIQHEARVRTHDIEELMASTYSNKDVTKSKRVARYASSAILLPTFD